MIRWQSAAFVIFSLVLLGGLGSFTFWQLSIHDGLYKEYFADGSLRSEVNYRNRKPDGVARTFYKNGKLKREANFREGVQHGVTKSYYENGQLKAEESYENSTLAGHSRFFAGDGKMLWEADFQKGRVIDSTRKVYINTANAKPDQDDD
jgi:antitoxin component YwqK of YwqJK toxin-antitoxin module